jgi:hypothetical protein
MGHLFREQRTAYLTGEDHPPARLEGAPQKGIPAPKPFGRKDAAPIIDPHLENLRFPVIPELGTHDLSHDRFPAADLESLDPLNAPPVLISPRQKEKKVLDGSDSFSLEKPCHFRSHTLDILNGKRKLLKTATYFFFRLKCLACHLFSLFQQLDQKKACSFFSCHVSVNKYEADPQGKI